MGVLEDGMELDGALCEEGTKEDLVFSRRSTVKRLSAIVGNVGGGSTACVVEEGVTAYIVEKGSTACIILYNCYSVYWFCC